MATQRVFDTYELVERILVHVRNPAAPYHDAKTLKTILLAQRVNKTFRYVIQRSHELQKILFFKQDPDGYRLSQNGSCRWNFLLRDDPNTKSLHYKQTYLKVTCSIASKASTREDSPVAGTYLDVAKYLARHPKPPTDAKESTVVESWRKMLICQPERDTALLAILHTPCLKESETRLHKPIESHWTAEEMHLQLVPEGSMCAKEFYGGEEEDEEDEDWRY